MQSRFKPKFWKDIHTVKNDKEIMYALYKIFKNVEKAENVDVKNNCINRLNEQAETY